VFNPTLPQSLQAKGSQRYMIQGKAASLQGPAHILKSSRQLDPVLGYEIPLVHGSTALRVSPRHQLLYDGLVGSISNPIYIVLLTPLFW